MNEKKKNSKKKKKLTIGATYPKQLEESVDDHAPNRW